MAKGEQAALTELRVRGFQKERSQKRQIKYCTLKKIMGFSYVISNKFARTHCMDLWWWDSVLS